MAARSRHSWSAEFEEPRRRRSSGSVAVFPPLVARSQNGSLDAYAEIVRVFQDRVFAYALACTNDAPRAKRTAFGAFVRAHASIGSLTDVNQVPGWLRREVRAGAREVRPSDELLARLASLPHEEERTCAALARVAGQDENRVAEFVGIPVSTARNRLDLARRRLKRPAWRELAAAYAGGTRSDDPHFADRVVETIRARLGATG